MSIEFVLLLIGLFIVSVLYSSVGHGGASGYLAILSLTSYGMVESGWLKQHVWILNLLVASIAFYHYRKEGFHNLKLTVPFIIGSIPMAFIGGYMIINSTVYDILLSVALIWAAWRLFDSISIKEINTTTIPKISQSLPWGAGIGLFSGVIGVGGGIFLSPILLLKKWANPKTVAATSAIFIWVNSFSGLMGATISNQLNLDLEMLLYFSIVVLIGGFVGSSYGSKIAKQSSIKKILIIVLLIAAMKRIIELISIY